MNKKRIVYDIETLPNYFCIVMSELDGDGIATFYIHEDQQDHQQIIANAKAYTLIGYNSSGYDDILIHYIMCNPNCTNLELYSLSKAIVEKKKTDQQKKLVSRYKYISMFDSIDVMTMLASSALRVSLKHLQVVIKWYNVQEFEVDWDKPLPKDQWEDCATYCVNDVLSLKAVCHTLKKDFELREYVQKTTGVECRSKDPVKIAEYAMCNAIAKSKGLDTDQFIKDTVAANRPIDKIVIKDILNPFITFKTKLFQDVLKVYQNFVLIPEVEAAKKADDKFCIPVKFNDMWLVFGLGGLHHNYGKKTGNKKFKPKGLTHRQQAGSQLLMPDVGSYYPSQRIMLNYEHRFDPSFMGEYKLAYTEKADAKREGNKMLEGYAKLKLNSVYGLYNSVYSPMYQPSVSYATAINGQLMLAMLIESFDLNGIKVLGTNTDSVTIRLYDHQKELYYQLCSEWETLTKMGLDHDEFKAIYEQSCNNYIAVTSDGKVKAKGFFVDDLALTKGYAYPVVKKALIAYFTKGISIEKYIREHTDIYDFCMSTRMGTAKNGNKFEAYHNGVKLQRTNRYYASKTGCYLYKSSDATTMQHVLKDSGVTIFNKYEEKTMEKYNINYSFYEAICRRIIHEVEPPQLTSF